MKCLGINTSKDKSSQGVFLESSGRDSPFCVIIQRNNAGAPDMSVVSTEETRKLKEFLR